MIKINGQVIPQGCYPDGTLLVKAPGLNKDLRELTFTWIYEHDVEIFTLQCLVDKFSVTQLPMFLSLPYVPHARMDRVKNWEDVFTLKTFCNMINNMGFDGIIIADSHSDVAPALLNNVAALTVNDLIEKDGTELHDALDIPDAIYFYPDAGAAKRYALHGPSTYGIKKRNWETGLIESFSIAEPEMVKGKNVIIVDDICSFGGTFSRAAAALKDAGAEEITLYVTHCEPNIFKGTVFTDGNVSKLVTTNSLLQPAHVPEELKDKVVIAEIF